MLSSLCYAAVISICAITMAQMLASTPAASQNAAPSQNAVPSQNTTSTPECRRDVFFTDSAMVSSQRNLQDAATAKPAELCNVWRKHVATLRKSIEVYQRCATPPERSSKLAPAQSSLVDFNEALKSRCKSF